MKFDKDLAAIHAYLCADGYVIKNPATQKHKYYYIGLRNTNRTLLEDFQKKFTRVFGATPIITNEGRCKIQSKEIFNFLTKKYSYYSYEWKMPKLTKNMARMWLRAYFDCEGWIELQKCKNRAIRADCVNFSGLVQIRDALKRFGIESTVRKRNREIWRINICGRDDITRFRKEIGFLHPSKLSLLDMAISSYKNYEWNIPHRKSELIQFIKKNGKMRSSRNEIRLFSIKIENLRKARDIMEKYGVICKLQGPYKNSYGTPYSSLVLKLDELIKLE